MMRADLGSSDEAPPVSLDKNRHRHRAASSSPEAERVREEAAPAENPPGSRSTPDASVEELRHLSRKRQNSDTPLRGSTAAQREALLFSINSLRLGKCVIGRRNALLSSVQRGQNLEEHRKTTDRHRSPTTAHPRIRSFRARVTPKTMVVWPLPSIV
jgi:hypothetical protein